MVASPPHSPGTFPQFSLSNIAKPIRYSVRSRAVFLPAPTLAPATDPAPSKSRHSTIKKKFGQHPTFLARTNSFIFNYSITGSFLIRLKTMLERTKKISFRISSILSKVEPESGAGAGSD